MIAICSLQIELEYGAFVKRVSPDFAYLLICIG